MEGLRYFVIFVLLAAIQLLVLNNINISGLANPIIYYYIILLLPVMPARYLLLLAFGIGLFIDLFSLTQGINAACCVLLAFIRDPLTITLKAPSRNEPYSSHISYLGVNGFLIHLIISSFLFHLLFTVLYNFSFSDFAFTLLQVVVKTVISTGLIFLIELFFFYRRTET